MKFITIIVLALSILLCGCSSSDSEPEAVFIPDVTLEVTDYLEEVNRVDSAYVTDENDGVHISVRTAGFRYFPDVCEDVVEATKTVLTEKGLTLRSLKITSASGDRVAVWETSDYTVGTLQDTDGLDDALEEYTIEDLREHFLITLYGED